MDLRQISVSFDQEQDRLLLRILGADGSQTQLWLTRRLMLRLWPVLQQLVAQQGAFPASSSGALPTPEARRMLGEVARAEALREADLGRPYEEARVSAHPLGVEPLLATQVEITGLAQGRCRLGFRRADGQGLELEAEPGLMQVLMHLLEQSLRAADWGLLPRDEEAAEPPAEPMPALLN